MAKLFSFRSQSVKQASTILAITALFSSGLGLARNLILYRVINPAELDTYFASFRIADFLFNIIIFGAITSAVIPIISGMASRKEHDKAVTLINQLLSWASVIMLIVSIVLALIMPQLVHVLVPGFDAERTAATVTLSRLLLLQTLFFSWSFIMGALLNGYKRFTSYALAPLMYNLSLIVGGFLAARFGVTALVYSVVVGSFLHFLIQFIEAKRLDFRPKFNLTITPELKNIVSLMIPRSLSQGIGQGVLIAYTALASGLQTGSIAIFNGMNDLQTTPTVIVANSLATACFPALSAQANSKDWGKMKDLLQKIIRINLFLLLPMMAIALILRAQVVRLYFGLGSANWDLTTLAIQTFAWFIIGIIPASLVALLARVFYATNDTKTPMFINLLTSVTGVSIAFIGIRYYGANVVILAASETLIVSLQAILYVIILNYRGYLDFGFSRISRYTLKYGFGALLLTLMTWLTLQSVDLAYQIIPWIGTNRIVGLLLQTVIASLIGAITYFGYSTLTSKQELKWLQKRNFS